MRSADDLLVGGDELLGDGGRPLGGGGAEVVHPFQNDEPPGTRLIQHVTVEPLECGGSQPATQDSVAADARVDDGDVRRAWIGRASCRERVSIDV